MRAKLAAEGKTGGNIAAAKIVGARLAEKAKAAGIESCAFDRSGYRYHGRVAALAEACAAQGFACLREGLRKHLAGIDVGLTTARLGVAASGTCLAVGDNEDTRLAGMISETHILILRADAIYPDLPSIAAPLRERMAECPGSYTTLITGPSRTADIERVSAVGVHGPLELHIVLLEDAHV